MSKPHEELAADLIELFVGRGELDESLRQTIDERARTLHRRGWQKMLKEADDEDERWADLAARARASWTKENPLDGFNEESQGASIGEIVGWLHCCSGPLTIDGVALHFEACQRFGEPPPVVVTQKTLMACKEFIENVRDFRCDRAFEEGDRPYNVIDYAVMDELAKELDAALTAQQQESER